MPTTYTFTIPALTPSNNKLVKGRTHWAVYRKMKQDWFYLVKLATQDIDIPNAQDFELRRVRVVSHRVSLLDRDNLAGGAKIFYDSLVAARVLFDDGPKFLESTMEQVQVRKRRDEKTVVTVTVF